MKTGKEIHAILQDLTPVKNPGLFLACPLHRAGACGHGNPDAVEAAQLLGWPERICQAIADSFDGDGWPDNPTKRAELYFKRFAMAKNAGRRECREFDNPGSTF